MGQTGGQKLKILRVQQILLERSSEATQLNATDIVEALGEYDISANRKSIYDDIATLQEAGVDVIKGDSGYYIGDRGFELPELKLLVDAVSASKFISERKSRSLVEKLSGLTSPDLASQLQRQVVVPDRVKTENEKIFYNIDVIYQCIAENVQMSFQYEEWTADKKRVLRHGGQVYRVSPAFLIRNDENYYLVAYDEQSMQVRHYRVDKIVSAVVLEEPRGGEEIRRALNPEDYAKQHVSMFTGPETTLTLRLKKQLVGVVLDKFGADVSVRPDGDSHIRVRINVAVSPQLYGWLVGVGATIVAPASEAEAYRAYLQGLLG